jgi:hypothetical protein
MSRREDGQNENLHKRINASTSREKWRLGTLEKCRQITPKSVDHFD